MKLIDYIKSKIVSLSVFVMVVLLTMMILIVFDVNLALLIYFEGIIVIGFIVIFCHDYITKRNYYNDFLKKLALLDQKYLISELIKQPNFIEGKIMAESIYEIDKSMNEHLKAINNNHLELKEYIEMWIHEVKTPLATSLMILENNPGDLSVSLHEELVKIDDYLQKVLFYARSTDVAKDYLIKSVSLHQVVSNVIKECKKDLIAKKIKIELNNLDVIVKSDSKWLEFIIKQIINNAIKYTSHNPVIKISSQKLANKTELSIEDNGIGVLIEEVDRVFDKGFTGTNGRDYQKSTGMGLYLCKKLCHKLNHDIYLSMGKTTKVTIVFPDSSFYHF